MGLTSSNAVKLNSNFDQCCHARECIRYLMAFIAFFKKCSKNWFSIFERFFVYAVLGPIGYALISCQKKTLSRYIIPASYKFSNVFLLIHHPWNGPFGRFFGPYSRQNCWIILKFSEVALSIKKTLLEKYFNNLNWTGNGTYSKFTILDPVYPQKT